VATTFTAKILRAFQALQLNSVHEEQYRMMTTAAKPHVMFLLQAMDMSIKFKRMKFDTRIASFKSLELNVKLWKILN
jgi:hypothetical protein